ncbi:DUF192 domain-containing protein [Shimazuella kribbensis]|uniref:DUF192 domain-containing protein n=1 Tax=Shimazuella kribbensis TaxID=139808 RepID=UPI000427E992|nr:DUF192 domain-containing protein [Shimazuella kribbensis]
MTTIYVYRDKTFFRKMELALTGKEQMNGLLGRTTAGSGLFFMGASAIHTYQMKFSIDVVYLNQQGLVIGIEEHLMPNRKGAYFERSMHVVEFNAGTIYDNQIALGERWDWQISI